MVRYEKNDKIYHMICLSTKLLILSTYKQYIPLQHKNNIFPINFLFEKQMEKKIIIIISKFFIFNFKYTIIDLRHPILFCEFCNNQNYFVKIGA